MLRNRVIPIVLIDGFSVLKTINFKQRRNLGSPITVARTYNTRNVDELILLDIDASKQDRSIDLFTIQDIALELFMPLTIGGGIKTTQDIAQALAKGADRVSINTAALEKPQIIRESSYLFGSQCIVVSIDVHKVDGQYRIYSHVGKIFDYDLFDWLQEVESLGAGEILLNNVDQDGLMAGIDRELIAKVAKRVSIPIIAAGGVANPQDCVGAIRSGASAIGVSSIFHFTSFTPDECKQCMAEHDIPVRL
jgi:imidazole glycerol-phosphate synthase subunit HisF